MGTLTITTTSPQDSRLVVAYGRKLGLRDSSGALINASAAQIKAEIIRMIKQDVFEMESATARETANAGVTDLGSVT